MESNSERRKFLKSGATMVGVIASLSPISKALASSCGITPSQTAGPFYPGESRFHPDNDLTSVNGRPSKAEGQVVYIQGKIIDQHCKPVDGAVVEIWQACASGKYNHSHDSNPAPLDHDFKYWGEAITDATGSYAFKTIIPGAYPADKDWVRPPHIHFKVSRLGYRELVTQMYFKGNPLNDRDFILQHLSPAEQASVVVDFQPSSPAFEAGSLTGQFDLVLRSVR